MVGLAASVGTLGALGLATLLTTISSPLVYVCTIFLGQEAPWVCGVAFPGFRSIRGLRAVSLETRTLAFRGEGCQDKVVRMQASGVN